MAEKLHVPAAKRGFGLGFGAQHQVAVYTETGPKTGALLTDEQCAAIGEWAATGDTRSVTEFIPPEALNEAVPNRLLHLDTIALIKLLPTMLSHMQPEERAALIQPLARMGNETWNEITTTRPHLQGRNAQTYFTALSEQGEGLRVAEGGRDILFNNTSMEALATLLPGLLTAMDAPERSNAVQAITQALHAAGEDKAFFQPLSDPNLNRLVLTDAGGGACNDIINNGRTLMIRSANGPKVKFQGHEFISKDLHFHPLRNANPNEGPVKNIDNREDATPEFLRFRDAGHEAQCKGKPTAPTATAVGQLHAIFVSPDKRALLLGADVKLGEKNEALATYIEKAKTAGRPLAIVDDATDAQETAEKGIKAADIPFNPLDCFHPRFDTDGLPEAPFMSLHLGGVAANSAQDIGLEQGKSDVFYRGVQVIHLPEPITISPEQLADLRALQPVLKAVDEETCVHPIARYQPAPSRIIVTPQAACAIG